MSNSYQQKGFPDREAYLKHLAETYKVDLDYVIDLADVLTPIHDFTVLVEELEHWNGDV